MNHSKANWYPIIAFVATFMLGMTTLWAIQAEGRAQKYLQMVESAKADARTAYGKLYTLEESHSDELEAARNEQGLKLWETQEKLDACLKGSVK